MNPKRRNARVGILVLPAKGRTAPPPRWPLVMSDKEGHAEAELELWEELWATPQAVEWERLGLQRVVAIYTRFQIIAETGNKDASAEARQYSDRLGVTPKAMRGLLWVIGHEEQSAGTTPSAPRSSRALKLVVNE